MAAVIEGRVRGRKSLGLMDNVKVVSGISGITVEAERQYTKDRMELRALVHT